MNKLKKAVSDLENYLGKDGEGIRLLTAISKHCVEIRKEAAECRQQSAEKDDRISSLVSAMQQSESTVAALRIAVQKEKDIATQKAYEIESLSSELKKAKSQIEKWAEPIEMPVRDEQRDRATGDKRALSEEKLPPLVQSMPKFMQVFDSLRMEMRYAPGAGFKKGGEARTYMLEDLVSSYSDSELLRLGKFVVCYCLSYGPCAFYAETTWKSTVVSGRAFSDSQLARIFRWFAKNNTDLRTDEEKLRGVKNTGKRRLGSSLDIDKNSSYFSH
jgi:hypothetical protein